MRLSVLLQKVDVAQTELYLHHLFQDLGLEPTLDPSDVESRKSNLRDLRQKLETLLAKYPSHQN